MSYDRSDAGAYVVGEHGSFFTELAMPTGDTQSGIRSILDRSFRRVGVLQAQLATATVDDTVVEKMEALLDYNALLRFERESARRVSVKRGTSGDVVGKERQQLFDHLPVLLAEAAKRCKALGVPVDGSGFEFGSYNLDILEPHFPAGVGFDD